MQVYETFWYILLFEFVITWLNKLFITFSIFFRVYVSLLFCTLYYYCTIVAIPRFWSTSLCLILHEILLERDGCMFFLLSFVFILQRDQQQRKKVGAKQFMFYDSFIQVFVCRTVIIIIMIKDCKWMLVLFTIIITPFYSLKKWNIINNFPWKKKTVDRSK